MKPLAELDQLNREPAAKNQVAAMLPALIDHAVQDAKIIQTQDAVIQAKDVKIAALTHELAYYKRIRFSTRSEALAPRQLMCSRKPGTPTSRPWKPKSNNGKITARVKRGVGPHALAPAEKCSCIFCIHHIPVVCRQALPAQLPRIEHRHEADSCNCG